jgi:hypothetical protein
MTRQGDSDVIAGGAGGMGPCPPPQHQPLGGVYTHITLRIYNGYTKDIHSISQKYTIYIYIYTHTHQVYTLHILRIYNLYTWYIQCIY